MGVAGGGRSDGQGSFWGDLIGPNPTDHRGKNGVKRSLLVETDGGPLSVVVAEANVRDDKLLGATLDAVVVERPKPAEEAPNTFVWTRVTTTGRPGSSWKGEATCPTSDASAR